MNCPLCEKRKPQRFCPARGEKICAVCCGTEREATIDCPPDCAYLVAAHRYEDEHRKPLSPTEIPFPDTEFPSDLIHEWRPLLSGLAYTLLHHAAAQREIRDAEVLEALTAAAETYRTLGSGIYYEKPPAIPATQELYVALGKFIQEFKQQDTAQAGFTRLKDSEVFYLLVFLLRVGHHQTNRRPRSRRFLEFLRAQFPPEATLEREQPRIITP